MVMAASTAAIGRSKKGRRLPSDLISEVTKLCSTMEPMTRPSTSAATGKPLRSMTKPITPKAATVTTANRFAPVAKAPTAQSSTITGITAARGARRTTVAMRIMTMPSGIMMMFARMNMM